MEPLVRVNDIVIPSCLAGTIPELTKGKIFPYILSDTFKNEAVLERISADYEEVMRIPYGTPEDAKFMNDHRREIHELNNKENNWSVQAFHMKDGIKDQPVGKHYHEKKTEVFVILEGRTEKLVACSKDEITKPWSFCSFGPGTLIIVPKLVTHTFYTEPMLRMICYSSAWFDKNNKDMIGVNLV